MCILRLISSRISFVFVTITSRYLNFNPKRIIVQWVVIGTHTHTHTHTFPHFQTINFQIVYFDFVPHFGGEMWLYIYSFWNLLLNQCPCLLLWIFLYFPSWFVNFVLTYWSHQHKEAADVNRLPVPQQILEYQPIGKRDPGGPRRRLF